MLAKPDVPGNRLCTLSAENSRIRCRLANHTAIQDSPGAASLDLFLREDRLPELRLFRQSFPGVTTVREPDAGQRKSAVAIDFPKIVSSGLRTNSQSVSLFAHRMGGMSVWCLSVRIRKHGELSASVDSWRFFVEIGNKAEVGRIIGVESRLKIKGCPTVGTGQSRDKTRREDSPR